MGTYRHTISAFLFSYAVKQGSHAGLSEDELCAAAGVNPMQLQDAGANKDWLPYEAYKKLLAEVVKLTGNDYFWLRNLEAQVVSLDNPGWYYYYNAPNLREATIRHEKFYFIHSRTAYPSYMVVGDEFCFRVAAYGEEVDLSPYHVDLMLSSWWSGTRHFTGPDLKLKGVRLTDADKKRKTAYENFFKASVTTNQPFNELVFEREVLDLPNFGRKIDPNLDSILERMIKPLLAEAHKELSIRDLVSEAIQRHLHHGAPKLKDIAKTLGMSNRTLQRKLAEIEITFSDLIMEARRHLAVQYLRQPGITITEVSLLLGYEEASAFTGAFRKWYGMSPSEYRRRQLS